MYGFKSKTRLLPQRVSTLFNINVHLKYFSLILTLLTNIRIN